MNPSVNIHQISKIVSQKAIRRKRIKSKVSQNDQELYETIKDKIEVDETQVQNKMLAIMRL